MNEIASNERKSDFQFDFKRINPDSYNFVKISKIIFGDQQTTTSVYKRDVFLDAFLVKSANKHGKFLANDYITPHLNKKNEELSPFTNPNPIQFLKVLPKVTFRFEFILTNEGLPVNIKLELFKQILLDLGIGAKTNVGYGQFEREEGLGAKEPGKSTGNEQKPDLPKETPLPAVKDAEAIKRGDKVIGTVISRQGKVHFVGLEIRNYTKKAHFGYASGIETGTKVLLTINNIQGRGKKRTFDVAYEKVLKQI